VHVVSPDDTARALGSGDLEVLGTPRLLAWCEAATVAALTGALAAGETSVGTRVELVHQRATPVGGSVEVRADLVHVDGRLLRFEVAAESDGVLVGHGTVTRLVVDTERFLARL
jgi:predicted thioesterase